jgi:glycosyltransferase involved in cell wall biosynthesis
LVRWPGELRLGFLPNAFAGFTHFNNCHTDFTLPAQGMNQGFNLYPMMKILFVHEKYGAYAGAEANIMAVASGLQGRGHLVGILHGEATGKGGDAWNDVFMSRFPLPADAGQIQGQLDVFKPDLIYVHKLADLEALGALFRAGYPLVRMIHDHDLYCMRSYKYNFFTRQVCHRPASPYCVFPCGAFLARNAEGRFPLKWVGYFDKRHEIELNRKFDRLVVASQYMKDELAGNGFAPDQIEIHPPVPPSDDFSMPSNFSDRNLIVFAGQIIRGKGVDVLLEALALVRVPFECHIFGDGNHRPYCEKLCRQLGLSPRVRFQGYVSPDELKVYYSEASVAVVSSVWPEPFGAVGLEALRQGVPVVAFDAGGIKEWLIDGYNGFLVPWLDRPAFAARVEQLLGDKPLARLLGGQGRTTVAEYYGFPKYLTGLEQLFVRVTNENHHAMIT